MQIKLKELIKANVITIYFFKFHKIDNRISEVIAN